MRAAMIVWRDGKIFLALCIILLTGWTAQGVPVQTGRYVRVRCRPDTHSLNCLEEQGLRFVIPEGSANMVAPPMADPMRMKKLQEHPDTFELSEDEYGSGNGIEPESGSGVEYDSADLSMLDLVAHQPDQDLKLKLTDEGLVLQKWRL